MEKNASWRLKFLQLIFLYSRMTLLVVLRLPNLNKHLPKTACTQSLEKRIILFKNTYFCFDECHGDLVDPCSLWISYASSHRDVLRSLTRSALNFVQATLYNPVFPSNKKMHVWPLTSVAIFIIQLFLEIGAGICLCITRTLLLRNGFLFEGFRVKHINLLCQIICPEDDFQFSALHAPSTHPRTMLPQCVCTVNMIHWLKLFQYLENL